MTIVFTDFTKCYPQTHASSHSSIRAFISSKGLSDDTLVPVIRDDQTDLALWLESNPHLQRVPTMGHAESVIRNLVVQAAIEGHKDILVVSYNGGLLKSVLDLTASHGISVVTKSFSKLGENANATGWNFNHIAPLDDAVEALKSALVVHRTGTVRQTDVRALLAQQDERFDFSGNATSSGTVGMISGILKEAERRGIVRLDRARSSNAWVHLTGRTSPTTVPPQPILNDGNLAISFPNLAPKPIVELPSPIETSSEPALGVVAANDDRSEMDEPEHRSRIMEEKIRNAKMGPFVTCRLACYQAIEELDLACSSYTLSELIQASIAGAREKLQENESTRDNFDSQPWRQMHSFLHKILTRSGAVLDGETLLKDSVLSLRKHVSSLSEDWQTKADSQILIAAIRNMDDVTLFDLPNLAGALYHDRSEIGEQRILRCLELLIEAGSVFEEEINGDQYLRVSTPGKPSM